MGAENGAEYMSGGILSGITGNRADLVVVDDPVKGRQEAESDVIRQRTIEAFDDDVKTRLKPGGSIIIIQTRWHEEDLAGSILPVDYAGESGIDPLPRRAGLGGDLPPGQGRARRRSAGSQGRRVSLARMVRRKHWSQFESKPRTWASLFSSARRPRKAIYSRPLAQAV
jgi:hypothetical protein